MSATVRQLFDANREALQLTWLAGEGGAARDIAPVRAAPADLLGYLNLIHPSRLHVFGHAETDYYLHMEPIRREAILDDVVLGKPPAIVVCEGIAPAPELLARCQAAQLPLLASPQPGARVIDALRSWVAKATADTTSMHGVFMDVLGLGVLISGESGLGKSELALELISRGHGLVADDVVDFKRIAHNAVEGSCPALLRNMLEVRGLGLLDIRTIFGETSIRRKMRLKLIVHLVRRSTMENEYQRLPLEALTQDVLGLPVRKVVIPVAAGRNMAVLTEAAVRSTVLSLRGIDTTREFVERQHRMIEQTGLE
ncbi:MAG TPA: HPr(Ser) kinase/phosphatase [Burkholderiaceae bacterium]|jgi:HPr kinase/phosphorylase|nr:HPr(Ser) kinase/phosphatase [Burkholderiaceae bacterium]